MTARAPLHFLCVAIVAMCRSAQAEPAAAEKGATLVALVVADPRSPVTLRTRANLDELGYQVVVLSPPDESSATREPLEQVARDVGAFAALRLVPPAHIDVWAVNPQTGRVASRELDAVEGTGVSPAVDTVAVGAVELLRASLIELQAVPAPAAPAEPDASGSPRLPARQVSLRLGAGPALAAWGATPTVGAEGSVGFVAPSGIGARVFGAFTFVPARLDVPEGSIDVSAQIIGAEATYAFARADDARWAPDVGVGATLVRVAVTGSAVPPLPSLTDSRWLAGPTVRAGLALAVAPGVRVRADAMLIATTSRPMIQAAGKDVARWESPTVGATLGLEVLLAR
jgi:hypothetical protein